MSDTPRLGVAILAAGAGSRFGGLKPLARFRGRSLLEHTLATAQGLSPARLYVVVGVRAEAVVAAVTPGTATLVHNPVWREGMATSIGAAARAAHHHCDGLLLLTVDQPLITTRHLQALVDAWQAAPDRMVAAFYSGKAGIPVLFPARCFDRLQTLRGDRGAGALLADAGDPPIVVELPEAALDVDTPEALAALAP